MATKRVKKTNPAPAPIVSRRRRSVAPEAARHVDTFAIQSMLDAVDAEWVRLATA